MPKTDKLEFRLATLNDEEGDHDCPSCQVELKAVQKLLNKRTPMAQNTHDDTPHPEIVKIKFTADHYAGGAFKGWHISLT